MPLVTPNSSGAGIEIPITGDSKDFTDSVDRVKKKLDELKTLAKQNGALADELGRKQAAAANSAKMSWTDFRSMYSTVLDVVRVGQQVWAATGQEFVNYAEQVKNMSRNLGVTAEETSRLIQVADDVRISYGSLNTAMKMAQKDGITPNIEGLAQLSDQYLALAPGVERSQFLMDKFGKSGLEMGKLLEMGGAGIRSASKSIDKNLIMTEKGIKSSDEYQAAVDDLSDSFHGMALMIGGELAPALTDMSIQMKQNIDDYIEFKNQNSDLAEFMNYPISTMTKWVIGMDENEEATTAAGKATDKYTSEVYDSEGALEAQKQAVQDAKDALKDYEDQLDAVSQANQDLESMSRTIAEDQKQYTDDHAEAVKDLIAAQEELAVITHQQGDGSEGQARAMEEVKFAQNDLNEAIVKYGKNSDEAAKARNKLEDAMNATSKGGEAMLEAEIAVREAEAAVNDLQASWHEAANNMVYDMVLVGLSVDGLLKSEQKAADEYAIKLGIKTQADVDEANRRRELADSTIAGILQSEDVLNEQRDIDAKKLALQNDITGAAVVSAANDAASAINNVSASTDGEIARQKALAAAARVTAAAYASIKYSGSYSGTSLNTGKPYVATTSAVGGKSPDERDNGGAGIAGTPYMIGTGAQPEMFVPSSNGTFIPNADKKMGGVTYNIVVNNPKKETAENSIRLALKNLAYTGAAA